MDWQQDLTESDPTNEDLLSLVQMLQDHVEQLNQRNKAKDEQIEALEELLRTKDEKIDLLEDRRDT